MVYRQLGEGPGQRTGQSKPCKPHVGQHVRALFRALEGEGWIRRDRKIKAGLSRAKTKERIKRTSCS
jgi:hypothetical protein